MGAQPRRWQSGMARVIAACVKAQIKQGLSKLRPQRQAMQVRANLWVLQLPLYGVFMTLKMTKSDASCKLCGSCFCGFTITEALAKVRYTESAPSSIWGWSSLGRSPLVLVKVIVAKISLDGHH
eukprot:scaffold120185_cov17-Tisochrysis_lutea.AAC.1